MIAFDNSYARLPERFYAELEPRPVRRAALVRVNHALAARLGVDPALLESPEGVEALAGNRLFEGSRPIAMAYAGHQFGHWNPQLGDGRAILLGEVLDGDGQRFDVQLKGSGRTPYSRNGDGRSPLGPVLREYIVSEAMAVLGVPTTRALAAVTTGEPVYRQRALPGGVLTRVASSHIRVGTFELFASRGDVEGSRALLEHVLLRHYPEAASDLGVGTGASIDHGQAALALLIQVMGRQAALIADWLRLGFIHGVMNTDNMLISGETIDYGPCAFMDGFDFGAVFSSIDRGGRYAYGNQPHIAAWNLARLGQALLPVMIEGGTPKGEAIEAVQGALEGFEPAFNAAYSQALRAKLGLSETREGDDALINGLLRAMQQTGVDFTLFFRHLSDLADPEAEGLSVAEAVGFALPSGFEGWLEQWRARLDGDGIAPSARQRAMYAVNPALIPRNHRVEEAIAAGNEGDFAPFHNLVDALARPFELDAANKHYALAPRPSQIVKETFCGT